MQIQKSWNAMIYAIQPGTVPYWLSDFPSAPIWLSAPAGDPRLLEARNWIFPPWLPQKLYLVGNCYIGQQQPPDGQASQVSFGIDRGRLSYSSSVPPWHQAGGDQHWEQLASMWLGGTQEQKFPIVGPPKYLDRTKDSIWLQFDLVSFGSPPSPRDIWLGFNYLADDTDVPPVLTGWNPLFAMTMEGASPGWTNYTIAQVVDPDWFSGYATGAGSKIRVTLSADHISSAYIGPRVPYTAYQAASLSQLTFGGNAGATANAQGLIVSDDMTFGIDTSNGVVVKIHTVDGAVRYRVIQPSAKSYYKVGVDDASNPNGTGYTTGGVSVNSVLKIEQFY